MRLSIIISLLILFSDCLAQNMTVSNDRNNFLYIGVDNPLTICTENVQASNVTVTVDKGEVFGSGSKRIYRGFEPGRVVFSLTDKKSGQKIGDAIFRVLYIPNPKIAIGNSDGGDTKMFMFKHQQYIRAELPGDFGFDIHFTVASFRLSIFRDSLLVARIQNTTSKFNSEILSVLTQIQTDDIIIIDKIFALGSDKRILNLKPVIFNMTD